MSGLRIHHPTVRDGVLVIEHPGDSIIGMKPKDLLIHFDGEGNSIVSEGVWERLKEATAGAPVPIMILNEVGNPPTIKLIAGDLDGELPRRRVFRQQPDGTIGDDALVAVAQQFAPRGITPRITSA